jgi:ADP-heptose:LPS heptosyltransferase
MEITGFDEARFTDLDDLTRVLTTASVAVGNDCGPMHLAGYMGIQGLSLFGPTSPQQWGPPGMNIICRNLPCSPCTQTARITCETMECMQKITLEQVKKQCTILFEKYNFFSQNKTGS